MSLAIRDMFRSRGINVIGGASYLSGVRTMKDGVHYVASEKGKIIQFVHDVLAQCEREGAGVGASTAQASCACIYTLLCCPNSYYYN